MIKTVVNKRARRSVDWIDGRLIGCVPKHLEGIGFVPIEEEKDERDEAVAGTTPNVLTNKKNTSKPVAGPTVKASIGSTSQEPKNVSIGSIQQQQDTSVDWIDELTKNKKCRLDRYERRIICRRDDRNTYEKSVDWIDAHEKKQLSIGSTRQKERVTVAGTTAVDWIDEPVEAWSSRPNKK